MKTVILWTITILKRENLKAILRRAGVSIIRFHDLRHTFASMLLANDAQPKVCAAPDGAFFNQNHNGYLFAFNAGKPPKQG